MKPLITDYLHSLPGIDYATHPAYGLCFGRSGLRLRARALFLFGRSWVQAVVEFFRYRLVVHGVHAGRRARQVDSVFAQNGVMPIKVKPEDMRVLRQMIFDHVKVTPDTWKKPDIGVQDFPIKRQERSDVFSLVDQIFTQTGVMTQAAAYLGRRRVSFSGVNVKFSGPSDQFKKNLFADIGLADPQTRYMHIDSSPVKGVVKAILYLTEVGEKNGPFRYVLGSHRLKSSWSDQLIRRAIHKSKILQKWNRGDRQLFSALPRVFQRKAEMGNDLQDSFLVEKIINSEKAFLSTDGDGVLFDNSGMHRGGLVEEGCRVILQVILR